MGLAKYAEDNREIWEERQWYRELKLRRMAQQYAGSSTGSTYTGFKREERGEDDD